MHLIPRQITGSREGGEIPLTDVVEKEKQCLIILQLVVGFGRGALFQEEGGLSRKKADRKKFVNFKSFLISPSSAL